jgi:hypothetical protein
MKRKSRSFIGEVVMTYVINTAVQERKKIKERLQIEREIARTKTFMRSVSGSCLVNRSLEMA